MIIRILSNLSMVVLVTISFNENTSTSIYSCNKNISFYSDSAISHEGSVDTNRCHEDGSGGFHCH